MVLWTSIATGLTMFMVLVIWRGNFGTAWRTSTASPHEKMWNCVLRSTPSIVWTYQLFQVGGAETNYVLTIGEGQGTGGPDSMAYHNGRAFTTRDRDNDARSFNCAARWGGAWWYKSCGNSNLNGKHTYHTPEDGSATHPHYRLTWFDGSSWQSSHFTKAAMKIRPKRAGCGAKTSTCK